MSDELIKVLIFRIENQEEKTTTKAAVLEAGYSDEEFEAAYHEALARMTAAETTRVPPVSSEVSEYTTPAEPAAAQTHAPLSGSIRESGAHRGYQVVAVVGFFLVVMLGAVAVLASTDRLSTPAFLTALFGGAPYTQENFIEGIGSALADMKSAEVTLTMQGAVVPRDPDVEVLPINSADMKAVENNPMLTTFSMPDDISFNLLLNGTYDVRELVELSTANRFAFDVTVDDFELGIDIDSRVVGADGWFLRLNKLDAAIFSLFLPNFAPLENQWVKVADTSRLREIEELSNFQREFVYGAVARLYSKVFTIANETGVLAISSPEKITYGDETAYRYQISLVAEAVPEFIDRYVAYLQTEFGEMITISPAELEELKSEIDQAYIAYLNQYAEYSLVVDSAGQVLAYEGMARFAPDDLLFKDKQVTASTILAFDRHNETFDITVPDEYLTTVEAAELVPALKSMVGPTIKKNPATERYAQELMQYMETAITTGASAPEEVCTNMVDAVIAGELTQVDDSVGEMGCKHDTDSYMVEFKLDDMSYYCTDSTGFAEWHLYPMMAGASCVYAPAEVYRSAPIQDHDNEVAQVVFEEVIKPLPACGAGNRLFSYAGDTRDSFTFDGPPSDYTMYTLASGGYILEDEVPCRADTMVVLDTEVYLFSSGEVFVGELCTSTGVVAEKFGRDDIFECTLAEPITTNTAATFDQFAQGIVERAKQIEPQSTVFGQTAMLLFSGFQREN